MCSDEQSESNADLKQELEESINALKDIKKEVNHLLNVEKKSISTAKTPGQALLDPASFQFNHLVFR